MIKSDKSIIINIYISTTGFVCSDKPSKIVQNYIYTYMMFIKNKEVSQH